MNQNHPGLGLGNNLRKSSNTLPTQSSVDNEKSIKSADKEIVGFFGKKKLLTITFVVVAFFCILAFFAKSFFTSNSQEEIVFQDIPQLICTVRTRGEGFRTLKICLSLEIAGAKSLRRINNHLPEIQNSLILFLSSLRTADLESAGFAEKLQREVHKRVENLFPGMIRTTVIKELLLE